ncbi:GTP-binding protein 8-like isoform X1 [Physella acuta]|uniref:GTP-binding protein 8-like isoform X1 n=1 Tax=Physella acuta TaxID=109671 RepID=UPI0027DC7672|nr:GTP-binding protein 8-like isoform X1 [Physella acuta]XP_059168048.1 GTP-binding protein 8-like isoform X1 [Physella acuta]XP_059168049.1 GTP-binding protein 8-like isoform X1 [Physella acuta]
MSGVILPKSFALLRKWPCHGLLALSWSCKRTLYVTKVRLNQPVSDLFTNPVDRLQPMVQIPIIPNSDMAFRPSRDEMEAASLMFERRNMKGETFQFLGSWPNPHIMPKWDVPEVAFIGKSNVGKSSLLAAMFAQVPDVKVKVSKKPGHTKLMNVFNVNNYFHLVDMPGYGFNMPDHFETSVEAYIKSRRNLLRVFMLIDATTGPVDVDNIAIGMMEEFAVPYVIVITKIDLARPATLIRSLMSVVKFRDETKADSCFPQPFLVSSVNGEGLAFLQSFIAYVTGNLQIKSLS